MKDDEAFARRLQQEEDARARADQLEPMHRAQAEEDAELAAAIALSLSVSPPVPSRETDDEAASLALARVLQAEEDASDRPVLLPYAGAYQAVQRAAVSEAPQRLIPSAAEIAQLEPAMQQVTSIAAQAVDIHLHSRVLGVLCREKFVPVDDRYQLSFFGDIQSEFNRIRPAIEAVALAEDRADLQKILNAIAAKPGLIEPETGLNMMSLLVKSWGLVEKSGIEENKGFIIHNLKHNIEAGGGCDAGIAARLVQPYVTLLNLAMQNASGFYGNRRVRISYR